MFMPSCTCPHYCSITTYSFHWIGSLFFLQGTLKGFDQTVNIILDESHERVFSSGSGVEQVLLGLYIIRGDNM